MELSNGLLFAFMNEIVGKQVDTKVIDKCLEMLCGEYSFDCGGIYEITQENDLILKERHMDLEIDLYDRIDIEDVDLSYGMYLEQENLYYLRKRANSTEEELRILKIFGAESLVIAPITDQKLNIQGMIVLLNLEAGEPFLMSEIELMEIVLTMLSSYISLRIYEKRVSFAMSSLERVLDNAGIDIYVNDFYNHDILYVNKSMAEPYGGIESFEGKKCWEVLFPGTEGTCEFCPQSKLVDNEGNPTKIYSWDYQRQFDGSWFRVFSSAFRWIDGRLAHVVSSADITDNKKKEAIIEYMANYDELTKLPNRRKFIADCEKCIHVDSPKRTLHILFFDIDGFKKVNDSLGHDAGDELLVKLGEFFASRAELMDSVYRNGGDEFVAIAYELTKEDFEKLGKEINKRFEQGWDLEKGTVFCGVSVGVASYPEDGKTVDELLCKADNAMYKVKKSGGAGICFTE